MLRLAQTIVDRLLQTWHTRKPGARTTKTNAPAATDAFTRFLQESRLRNEAADDDSVPRRTG
jgi:hypothetical protein